MASFGVAPVAVAWLCGNRTPLDAAIAVAYVVCVAQRLAYFGAEETPADGPRRFYSGLPVTFGSLVFALAYPVLPLFGGAAFAWTLRGAVVLLAALYVLNFPMPKPRGLFYPVFILLALAISAFWVLRMIG